MERHMSKSSQHRRSALAPALALATLAAAVTLSGCTPDTGPASASDAAAAGPNAAAAARTEMTASNAAPAAPGAAPKAVAPVCPKLVAPQCPPPAPASPAAQPRKPLAAAWSGAARRLWSRHRFAHGAAYAGRARHDWEHGRPWPGDRPDGDRLAAQQGGHGELMGGPNPPPPGAYADRFARAGGFESHETVRAESWRSDSGEHREFREALRPCPDHCGGPRRFFGYAGIDDRGYLVWPGKVEY
jgi:hypothetical protein